MLVFAVGVTEPILIFYYLVFFDTYVPANDVVPFLASFILTTNPVHVFFQVALYIMRPTDGAHLCVLINKVHLLRQEATVKIWVRLTIVKLRIAAYFAWCLTWIHRSVIFCTKFCWFIDTNGPSFLEISAYILLATYGLIWSYFLPFKKLVILLAGTYSTCFLHGPRSLFILCCLRPSSSSLILICLPSVPTYLMSGAALCESAFLITMLLVDRLGGCLALSTPVISRIVRRILTIIIFPIFLFGLLQKFLVFFHILYVFVYQFNEVLLAGILLLNGQPLLHSIYVSFFSMLKQPLIQLVDIFTAIFLFNNFLH